MKTTDRYQLRKTSTTRRLRLFCLFAFVLSLVVSCAKMGQPDGGWYDETPPRVIGATPADKETDVKARKVAIYFNEYIKIDNPTEKVVVSPPQLEAPEIKGAGRRILVELKDSLKPNTTYTIDFSDAISDNNEGNPLGNYTYSFSTGTQIDTMEVSGYVFEAADLEPVKGILVGLHSNLSDTVFHHEPFLRVSRTDSRGRFVIKGVAPGSYRIYALQDADGNYLFNQKSEKIAFNHDIIVPSSKPDTRPDTLWRDSLHIEAIRQIHYTHFLPDNIVLRAFTEVQTDRYFLKSERTSPDRFTLFFSYGSEELPHITGLNFPISDSTFVVETTARRDTITYWLRDSALINQDTLYIQMQYLMTDSAGLLQNQTDTLEILAKETYEKRMKKLEKAREEWQKKADKAAKKGNTIEPFKTDADEPLKLQIDAPSQFDPDLNIKLLSPTPLQRIDTAAIHLYAKHDTLWYKSAIVFREVEDCPRTYELLGEWRPDVEYSLEIDSAAFTDIYGKTTLAVKQGFKVKSTDDYSTVLITLTGTGQKTMVVQLIDKSDKVIKEVSTDNGSAEFFYVKPDTYYLRAFEDDNGNGLWDTGNFDADQQPEAVYYYSEKLECKAKWDVTRTWSPKNVNADKQKPAELVKQKADKEKTIKHQNLQRAKKLGIEYVAEKGVNL